MLIPVNVILAAVPAVLIVYVPLAFDDKPVGMVKFTKEGPLLVAPPPICVGVSAYCRAIPPKLFKSPVIAFLFAIIAFALKRLIPTTIAIPTIIIPRTIKRSCC